MLYSCSDLSLTRKAVSLNRAESGDQRLAFKSPYVTDRAVELKMGKV